jgi:hypothetical protein
MRPRAGSDLRRNLIQSAFVITVCFPYAFERLICLGFLGVLENTSGA